MSSALLSEGPPEAKKFRIEVPSQLESSISPPSSSDDNCMASNHGRDGGMEGGQPMTGEAPLEGQSPAGPSSARSSNGSEISNSSIDKEDDSDMGMAGNLLEMISKSLLGNVFKLDDPLSSGIAHSASSPSPPPALSTQAAVVPGAKAVAQSPAAALFAEDDWSWHRNPAAAIRSGGTNKQTPVWKYFVYNKVENISRCIVGDCAYMLKGPHTSTLACHLKKHPVEYAEFQKLKVDYTRERHGGQMPPSPCSSAGGQTTPRPPKIKKESRPDMSQFMNAMRTSVGGGGGGGVGGPAVPVSAARSSPMPNLMQNLLGMNPLQFMMNAAHQNNNQTSASQAAILQQAGLTVSSSGQITQSKKWRRDERRQRELESRLALALAASHVPSDALNCPLWRDLMEAAQPKFCFPDDVSQLEQLTAAHHGRLLQAIKSHLASSKRVCLVVEALRIPCPHQEQPIQRIAVSATFPGYNGHKYELQHVLLALRPLAVGDSPAESVTLTVEQVLSDFELSMDKVSRVVCSGIKSVIGEEDSNLFDCQMESASDALLSCFSHFVESSVAVEDLRKAVFSLIFAFVTKPDALHALNKAAGGSVDLPLTEPFIVLAEAVLRMKDALLLISDQTDTTAGLSEEQWNLLSAVCTVSQLFRQSLGGEGATVDGVIPSIRQLVNAIEKDSSMSGIADELKEIISKKMGYVLDVNSQQFDGTFIQATSLNPQMAVMLTEEQVAYARKTLLKQLSSRLQPAPSQPRSMGVDALLATVIGQGKMGGELASNPLYAGILQHAQERMQDRSPSRDRMAETLISSYFDEVLSGCSVESLLSPFSSNRPFGNPFQPPLQFWQQATNHCPQLSELACSVLSIPSNPRPSSRLLSLKPRDSPWSSIDSSLLLSHLDRSERLERDLLLKANRQLLPKTY